MSLVLPAPLACFVEDSSWNSMGEWPLALVQAMQQNYSGVIPFVVLTGGSLASMHVRFGSLQGASRMSALVRTCLPRYRRHLSAISRSSR